METETKDTATRLAVALIALALVALSGCAGTLRPTNTASCTTDYNCYLIHGSEY